MFNFLQSQSFIITWLITGTVSFIFIILTLIFFGKLIYLQFRIWILSSKGFHLIEHIGLDKVRNYYYLRPNNNKFDFNSGFYLHQKETTTKIKDGLIKPDGAGWNLSKMSAMDEKNQAELKERVEKFIYNPDSVTLRWGIPIITYVGNNPHPVNFAEPNKTYGAQVIRDIYIRLLATQRYKDMIRMMVIGLISLGVIAIALIFLFKGQNTSNQIAGSCLNVLNSTQSQLITCINQSARVAGQSSTILI